MFSPKSLTVSSATRDRLLKLIGANPGIHLREIQRRSMLGLGTIQYQLGILSRMGAIRYRRSGRLLQFFTREVPRDVEAMAVSLQPKSRAWIVNYLLRSRYANHQQIVKASGLAPSTVSWHIKRLMQFGIISMEERGGKTMYKLCDEDVVAKVLSSRLDLTGRIVDRVLESWGDMSF